MNFFLISMSLSNMFELSREQVHNITLIQNADSIGMSNLWFTSLNFDHEIIKHAKVAGCSSPSTAVCLILDLVMQAQSLLS